MPNQPTCTDITFVPTSFVTAVSNARIKLHFITPAVIIAMRETFVQNARENCAVNITFVEFIVESGKNSEKICGLNEQSRLLILMLRITHAYTQVHTAKREFQKLNL